MSYYNVQFPLQPNWGISMSEVITNGATGASVCKSKRITTALCSWLTATRGGSQPPTCLLINIYDLFIHNRS